MLIGDCFFYIPLVFTSIQVLFFHLTFSLGIIFTPTIISFNITILENSLQSDIIPGESQWPACKPFGDIPSISSSLLEYPISSGTFHSSEGVG